jgi:hypothetical protein
MALTIHRPGVPATQPGQQVQPQEIQAKIEKQEKQAKTVNRGIGILTLLTLLRGF